VRSGGHEVVAAHAVASASQISSGGHEAVSSDGAIVGAQLFNGGVLVVSSGGVVSGGLIIHAGSATLDGAMAAGQTVSFAGAAGTLKLDNLAAFHARISGFGHPSENLDLGGFVHGAGETVTWTQAGTSGTLTVHDGAKVASLSLIGAYATADFKLFADGAGGTFVRAPTVTPGALPATAAPDDLARDQAATRFTQAAAALESGRAGPAAATPRGLLEPAPLVTAATSGR
jgi:autotransporter passenger strand-loop-strand repeat protein